MEDIDEEVMEQLKQKAIERTDDVEIKESETVAPPGPVQSIDLAPKYKQQEPPKKKTKKVRSEAQKAAFEKARKKRSENLRLKREQKAKDKVEKKERKKVIKQKVEDEIDKQSMPALEPAPPGGATVAPSAPKVPPGLDTHPGLGAPVTGTAPINNHYYYYGTAPPQPLAPKYWREEVPESNKPKRDRKKVIKRPPTPSSSEEDFSDPDEPESYKELQQEQPELPLGEPAPTDFAQHPTKSKLKFAYAE